MSGSAEGAWRFPGWRHFGRAAVLALAVLAVFWLVYGATDYFSQGRTLRRIHFEFELGIPFVPAMTLAYVSMCGLFFMAPFLLPSRRELVALALTLVASILVAGVGFTLWPAESGFPPPQDLGIWADLYHAADRINLRYNMVPSLHVALTVTTVAILARGCRMPAAAMLWCWGLVICVSTVLTHQHHLIDVATGAALGLAVDRMVYRRIMSHASIGDSRSRLKNPNTSMHPCATARREQCCLLRIVSSSKERAEPDSRSVSGQRPVAPILPANPATDQTPSA
jgi:membrane-associated phospholipid phosphatase